MAVLKLEYYFKKQAVHFVRILEGYQSSRVAIWTVQKLARYAGGHDKLADGPEDFGDESVFG